MVRISTILLFVFLFSISVAGQNNPPPPLIWTPPDATQTYTNFTYGFSVDLPETPEISEGRLGAPSTMNFYTVRRPGSLVYVRVINFTEEELKKVSSQELIRQIKSAHSSKTFKIGTIFKEGVDHVDYSSSDGATFRRVNARIADGKLYELYIDVTNWHILTESYPETVKKFNAEADRFFKSFKLSK